MSNATAPIKRKVGRPVADEIKVITKVYLPSKLYEKAQGKAFQAGESYSAFVARAIKHLMKAST